MNIQFPKFLRPLWRNVIWRKDPSKKVIYLTFDDGPVPEVTPFVLDILDKYNVKATFFSVGENVKKHPETYEKILKLGHQTGNHTYNHLKGFDVSLEKYVENTKKAALLIDSKLFRPPHGQITFKQKNTLLQDYQIIMWDLITHDYNHKLSAKTILKTIKKHTRNGSIVVFHDSLKAKNNVLQVLPVAIEYWKSEGYGFELL